MHRRPGRSVVRFLFAAAIAIVPLSAGAQFRKLGELELRLTGLNAVVDPTTVTVPKNTPSGVRVAIRSGTTPLSATEAARLLGGSFVIEGDVSGPGLRAPLHLPQLPLTPGADPFLLTIPSLTQSGDYSLSNLRITVNGATALDVAPQRVPITCIEQVLITSVTTRPLTLDEIRQKGIVLDSNSYLGFEFTLGLALDSKVKEFTFPVVFDKRGVAVPQPTLIAPDPERAQMPPLTTIVPMLLKVEEGVEPPSITLPSGETAEIRIPSVLVFPGNTGFLKQHFSAKLFVANGAPGGSNLTVLDVTGKINLPKGADQIPGTPDDPLTLPDVKDAPQPSTQAVHAAGADGQIGTADDIAAFAPGEQGEAEFLIRGEKEGFHTVDFDVEATLAGLVTGPVHVTGSGQGGVLVRNPYFDMTFTAPAVVRNGELFTLFLTVNNISQSLANAVSVTLDTSRMAGVRLVGDGTQTIDTLPARDARTLEFQFQSERTGQLVATYINFDTQNGTTGNLKFTLGVGERGVPLSPDTLVLPAATSFLPQSVVSAAMRVLGQAWSITNAPGGSLPSGVIRTTKETVTKKALALAEAGLRVSLGQSQTDAVRDLLFDFYGGSPVDAGFDQILRTTSAGTDLARAIGAALQQTSETAGGATEYERQVAQIAASGADFVTFAVGNAGGAPVSLAVVDALGRRSASNASVATFATGEVTSAVSIPFGGSPTSSRLAVIGSPTSGPYKIEMTGLDAGTVNISATIPSGNGSFIHATASSVAIQAGAKYSLTLDPSSSLILNTDLDANGTNESSLPLATQSMFAQGPQLVSATVIGPETLAGAAPFGFHAALLFDRIVSPSASGNAQNYTVPKNKVLSARRQLSGRLVFLNFEQPEGPYVPTQLSVANIADGRQVVGPAATKPLGSRLADIGAVVTGRVINSDNAPIRNAQITYAQNPELTCAPPLDDIAGLTMVRTDDNGRYELRYVRQDNCGMPFQIATRDPNTGALRSFSSSVRVAGEQIVLDIAMFGRGSVTGTVRSLTGAAVAGADVSAISQTDPQSSGATKSDTDGHYRIDNLIVGPITVHAVMGASLGRSNGRIDRAGTAATVDLTLDGGTVRASGIVRKVQGTEATPIPSLQVVYYVRGGDGLFIPIALTTTDSAGAYSFVGMPTGEYRIEASLNSRDRGAATGIAAAGDVIAKDIAIVIGGSGFGTVRGVVKFPDGAVAAGIIVSIDDRGVLSNGDGSFELTGVVVKPADSQRITARSRDGLRGGFSSVLVSQPDQLITNVVIILSGIGNAEFTVLDANRNPVIDQDVVLMDGCANPCGCSSLKTNSNGKVLFEGVPLGTVHVRASRTAFGTLDQTSGIASVVSDGSTAFGVMQFSGFGTVSGTVLNPDNSPALGADVQLIAKVFNEDICALVEGIAQRVRTDSQGKFRFTGVNIGAVGVIVTHPFFTTNVGARGTLTANGGTVDFPLKLVNTISGVLLGTVYLPDGSTPAGAGVEVSAVGPLPEVTVTTDVNGAFKFAKIFPEGTYTLTARDAATGGVRREQVYLRAGQDQTHDLRLKGRGTVNVRVVNGAGQPVLTSVFVRLEESDYPNRTYEAALEQANNGIATFTNVFEGPLTATVSDAFARGGRASSILASPGATLDLTVAITTTGTVTGHFYKADGTTPIPFGAVRILANGTLIGQATTNGSDDVGAFSFSYVPAGPVRIEATDPQTARSGVAAGSVTSEGEIVTLDVKAQGLGKVQGLVTSNGSAQPGANVTITSSQYQASTLTDSTGNYLVDGIPEGQVVVTASLSGNFLTGSNSGVLAGEASMLIVNVALRDSGKIAGKVVNADGVTAAALSYVTAVASGVTLSTTSDTQGNFTFDRVPTGLTSLNASVLGGIDKGTSSVEVVANTTAPAQITLNGVGSIVGRSLDSAGDAIAGDITITGSGTFPYSFTVQSQGDGNFELPQVLAGPFTANLRAKSGEFFLYGTTAGTVPVGSPPANVTVQVQPSGTVTAYVVRSDGTTPAVGTNVTLQLDPNRGTVNLQAGNDGHFTARGVPLGAFTVHFNDPLTTGLARRNGNLASNGDTADLGTVVLDDKALTVLSVTPPDGATGVPINTAVLVTLSNQLQSAAGIALFAGTTPIGANASLSADATTVTLTGIWPDSKEITVSVSTGLTDIFGRHPLTVFTSKFQTVDLSPPQVLSIVPANDAVEVPVNTTVAVTFNEPLAATTNLSTLVTITGANNIVVDGSAAFTAPSVVTFTPAAPIADNTIYNVTVNGAIDLSGNVQTQAFFSKFASPDTVAPMIMKAHPTNAWINNAKPLIDFMTSDLVSGIDANSGTLAIDGQTVNAIRTAASISYTPPIALAEGSHTADATVADRAGNTAGASATFGVDTIPPSEVTLAGVSEGQPIRGVVTISATATDAGSGVGSIQLLSDNNVIATLSGPQFSVQYNTTALSEGAHTLSGRAIDVAGNPGPANQVIHVIVDNQPLSVTITQPAANARVRNEVTVAASPSEVVLSVAFTVAGLTMTDTAPPYEATFDVAALSDGTQTIDVLATSATETATATRNFFVDHTPPPAPDASRMFAEPPAADGRSLVYAVAGAVEANAVVDIVNTTHPATATVTATPDGTFSTFIEGSMDDVLTVTATDTVGNRGPSTNISIRRTPSLPPAEGSTTLRFDGILVDRVGAAAGALAPDGKLDAVFAMTMSIGDGVTRQLSFIDLTGNGTRSTRAGFVVLGVATDAGGQLLNSPNNTLSVPVTNGTSLTLFAAAEGFIQGETTYTVTAMFTDGSRFVASCVIQEAADQIGVPHSATVSSSWSSVIGDPASPGTTTITISNVRDIEGQLVPDGTNVAVAVAAGATKNPFGGNHGGVGGAISDGVTAANNPLFKVFTLSGGQATATYSTASLVSSTNFSSIVAVQVIAADQAGNIIGTEAIGTTVLNLSGSGFRAQVHATPPSLYGDRADRRAHFTIRVNGTNGLPAPDGTKILVSAADCFARFSNNACYGSAGGTILGGSGPNNRVFTVTNGIVEGEFSSVGMVVGATGVITPNIQILPADANGNATSAQPIGFYSMQVVGAAAVELEVAPDTLPYVDPLPNPARVRAHHVHDIASNLVPEDANIILSAADCASRFSNNSCVGSSGGIITDGNPSPNGPAYRYFKLENGDALATYSTQGFNGTVGPGGSRDATIQAVMADNAGAATSFLNIGRATVHVVGPYHALGSVNPTVLFGDGRLVTSTVTFDHILDVNGNPLPEGSKVIATAADCAARFTNNACLGSVSGSQILNGDPSPSGSAYKVFTITDGKVVVQYGAQGVALAPGASTIGRVALLGAFGNGQLLSQVFLTYVEVTLIGTTSGQGSITPTAMHADGRDFRASVTFTNFKDRDGRPVPDGTRIALSAADCAARFSNNACVGSAGGAIIGGDSAPFGSAYRIFTVTNNQIVAEYSSLNIVPVNQLTATIVALSVSQSDQLLSIVLIGSTSIQLLASASAIVEVNPVDIGGTGVPQTSNVTVRDLKDFSTGALVPDGTKVALTVVDCASRFSNNACVGSVGGDLIPVGTVPGDGTNSPNGAAYKVYTVSGGRVLATYSSLNIVVGQGGTSIANVQVLPTNQNGALLHGVFIGRAEIKLHGTTSVTMSGPNAIPRNGGAANVTIADIKDSAGNVVPDGTVVVASVADCAYRFSNNACVGSAGGTILNGTDSPSGAAFKQLTVMDGSVVVEYSTAGASTGSTVTVQVGAGAPNGTRLSGQILVNGSRTITLQ